MIKFKDPTTFEMALMKLGYTQRSFAKKIGISSPYLSQIIKGDRNPSPKVAKKIFDALEKNFDDIFFIHLDNKSYQTKTA